MEESISCCVVAMAWCKQEGARGRRCWEWVQLKVWDATTDTLTLALNKNATKSEEETSMNKSILITFLGPLSGFRGPGIMFLLKMGRRFNMHEGITFLFTCQQLMLLDTRTTLKGNVLSAVNWRATDYSTFCLETDSLYSYHQVFSFSGLFFGVSVTLHFYHVVLLMTTRTQLFPTQYPKKLYPYFTRRSFV